MSKSAIVSRVFHTVIGTAVLLWLLWYFFPIPTWAKGLLTLVLVMVACGQARLRCRRHQATEGNVAAPDLPLLEHQSPVVLVCGDGLDALFAAQPLRKTGQGCWLHVADVGALTEVVRNLRIQQPQRLGQLSIMYACLPDQHQNEAALRATLKSLRQQVRQLSLLTGFPLSVVINCQFSGPEIPWIIVRGEHAVICPANDAPLPLREWQTAGHITALPVLGQAFTFCREILLDELAQADRLYPPVHPFAVALRTGYPAEENHALWAHWLHLRSCLQFPPILARSATADHFPDAVLALLSPYALPEQGGQASRRVVCLLMCCALAAIGFSVANNRYLIHQIGADLQRWHAIPMIHSAPKAQSLAALQQDALLLERWQRQGEPLKYSLGLYSGQRLWLTLQQAIDTYIPPPHTPTPVETHTTHTVRLDALSLFDTGKFQLNPGSTNILVNALIGIKAKPGWLIVVAGHTDITGDAGANQVLSRKRAEALRDWMLATSDLSPTCFAIQGYGATRPIATNDTAKGRAANRRVDISLVPQVDACQAPIPQHASNE